MESYSYLDFITPDKSQKYLVLVASTARLEKCLYSKKTEKTITILKANLAR